MLYENYIFTIGKRVSNYVINIFPKLETIIKRNFYLHYTNGQEINITTKIRAMSLKLALFLTVRMFQQNLSMLKTLLILNKISSFSVNGYLSMGGKFRVKIFYDPKGSTHRWYQILVDRNIAQILVHRNIRCNYIELKNMNYLINYWINYLPLGSKVAHFFSSLVFIAMNRPL